MKKYLLTAGCLLALLIAMLPAQIHAQGSIDWEELWINVPPSPGNTTHPNAWMIPSKSFTGLAYDKWRDVVYIVNPHTSTIGLDWWQTPRIYAWNASNGQPALHMGRSADAYVRGRGGELPVPIDTIAQSNGTPLNRGYSQNTYCLYKIDLDDEGRIFACNLVSPIWGICILDQFGNCIPEYLGQGPYRVWRWDTPTATPVLGYATLNPSASAVGGFNNSEMIYTRWGDAFDVVGQRSVFDPGGGNPPYTVDSVRIYTSGGGWVGQTAYSKEVNVILADNRQLAQRPNRDVLGGGKLDYRLAIRLENPIPGSASHGVAATNLSMLQNIWMDSNLGDAVSAYQVQDPTAPWPQFYNQNATGNRSLVPSLAGYSGTLEYFELQQYARKFLVLADGYPTGGVGSILPNENTTARVVDVTDPNSEFVLWSPTPELGGQRKPLNNNSYSANWISDVDYKLQYYTPQEDPDAPGLHIILFVLMSNNGIAAYRSRQAFPVELSSLSAIVNGEEVDLSWNVTMETNNFGFEIERSFNGGQSWEKAGFVAGRGTTTEPMTYGFKDAISETHRNVGNVKYRLRQIDNDGSQNYSPIVDVYFDAFPTAVTLYQNYPNPFNPTTTISYQLMQPGHVTLKVFNALGETIGTLVDESKDAGSHQVQMNSTSLPSGTYIYQINVDGQVAQKKMTVMK